MGRIGEFLRSFRHAGRGVALTAGGRNFRLMLAAAGVVLVVGALLDVSRATWTTLLLCVALVLGAEVLNTAIERLADVVHPNRAPAVRDLKDVAAGAVLVVSLIAAVVGIVALWPYVAD
jgi:diacylglycerol kinase